MTWFKVDDSFYDHPKIFDAPDCAVALWVRAGTWSARNLTDGFVPANLPARLCDDHATAVRELVDRGLWKRTRGGYQFHDWREYQPTADSVRDLRAKRAEAGRRGGQAKAAKQTASKNQASASPVAKQNAAPSRPEGTGTVTQSQSSTDSKRARELQATRLLADRYGLTEQESLQVIAAVEPRAKGPIKNLARYMERMAEGDLADIVKAVMDQTDKPPDLPVLVAVPDWCGECDHPEYRWIELDDGRVKPCPRCRPPAEEAS